MIQDDILGDYSIADEEIFDVQTITDAMMTTGQSLTELGIRFLLNLLVCWLLVHFFYYRKSHRRDYYFTFMVFSSAMVLLLYMMGNAEVGVGLTLGLFAIFGVIRYRTETVPIREMTYLFVIIALAALNGLSPLYRLVGAVTDHPHYALDAGTVGVTALANLLYNWGLAHFDASRAGVYLNVEPLVGALLGVTMLGEQLGPSAALGGALIVGTALYISRTQ